MNKTWCVIVLLGTLIWHGSALALPTDSIVYSGNSQGVPFRVEQVAEGLRVPWGMAFVSDAEIMFTEQNGRIGILRLDTLQVTYLAGVPGVRFENQGGLLDVAVPPDYRPGGWIYFTYSKTVNGQGVTVLGRAKRDDARLVDWQELLISRSESDTDRHYGSRIAFDGNSHLFVTIGDRGVRSNGQDLSSHAGSVLRLHMDGSVPVDNPFYGSKQALPEIYSYGHRNPQGIVYDVSNKRVWAIEHGPRGGDEINLIQPGRNYGWPVISYGKEYWGPVRVGEGTHKKGMEQPVKVYTPSIAPGSLLLYSGKAFAHWKGDLFAGALKLEHINRIRLDKSGRAVQEERLLDTMESRIRALIEGPQGLIYFSTDKGRIYRIRPDR